MTEPTVLTVILNYRTPDLTVRACEAALREMQDLPGEVIVVDNASDDGSVERLQQEAAARGWDRDGRLRIVESGRNGGFGAGMNFGMRAGLSDGSAPDFYYLLNSDAWPDPGCILKLRDFLVATPKAGFAASAVRGEDHDPHQTAFRFPTAAGEFEAAARTGPISRLLRNRIVPMPLPRSRIRVDWASGASLMIRREVIEATGGFDETFFLYFEETDLCRRAALVGWETWYLPDAGVIHIGSASTGMRRWNRMPQYWFDSRLHYFLKNHGRAYTVWTTLALIAGTLLWRLRQLIRPKPSSDPDGFLTDLIAHAARRALGRTFAAPAPAAALPEDSR
ncbi:glycosyltransferase family 2 protein [Ruegeria aquimaris]|uniref:Glycosyltransferase family 2 protein n=1 Tax=Ruegeria aquimaris TaxID=2984333 RepID=A0ABT3AI89_9RHOB|nr:glycosyltransferase family 2 protein [Ruegeria sp. XHP0148]MCV2888365.1 glycosyltransferase family 2 protein [Ruegeria sp. XHP0148]